MGKSIEIPEMKAYLKKIGYEFVGIQYVPLVPTSPPTTQLMWLKENKVDLALGVMVNPGSQPTVKEMVRLGMGPYQPYKMTFACARQATSLSLQRLWVNWVTDLSSPAAFRIGMTRAPGVKLMNELQKKYHPNKFVSHSMYVGGFIEVMMQVEALRLAMLKKPLEQLKPVDVLNNGFYQIKNFDTGGIAANR